MVVMRERETKRKSVGGCVRESYVGELYDMRVEDEREEEGGRC